MITTLKNIYIYFYINLFRLRKEKEYISIINKKDHTDNEIRRNGEIHVLSLSITSFIFWALFFILYEIYRRITGAPFIIPKGIVYLIFGSIIGFTEILLFYILKIEKLNYIIPKFQPAQKSLDRASYVYWAIIIVGILLVIII